MIKVISEQKMREIVEWEIQNKKKFEKVKIYSKLMENVNEQL